MMLFVLHCERKNNKKTADKSAALPLGWRTYDTLNTKYQFASVYSTSLSVALVYTNVMEMSIVFDLLLHANLDFLF